MRILLISEGFDFRYNLLLRPFEMIKAEVGFIDQVDFKAISEYSPDIVIHNTNKLMPSIPNVKIDTSNLKPFVDPNFFKDLKFSKKYASDAVYVGNLEDFGEKSAEIGGLDCKIRVHSSSIKTLGLYCGVVTDQEAINCYHCSKASLIPPNDLGFREFDIIAAGGNPVKDDYVNKIKRAIDGERFSGSVSKDEILNKHTNFDVLSSILKNKGLKGLSNMILKAKQ